MLGDTMLMSNVGAHLSKRALLNPKLEALVDVSAGRRFTYAELDARANQAARALTAQGLVAGDRVAVLLPNSHEFVETFYGAARAGLVGLVTARSPLAVRTGRRDQEAVVRLDGITTADRDILRDALRIVRQFRELIRVRYQLAAF